MKSKNIFLYLLLVVVLGACQPNKWEQENDAVFKSIKKEYSLNDDGSVSYRYQHELKYITHYSFNRLFGESFIVYNPQHQQLKINKAETKMADGKIVASPENAFNDVLPRFAAGAPVFNHMREMVVTHTGLELGCVVNFDYEINSNVGYLPYLNDNITIQQTTPIEKMEIVVSVPENKTLNYKLINSNVKPVISKKDGVKTYTWKFKNIEAVANEYNQASENTFLPKLSFSTVSLAEAISLVPRNVDLNLTDEIKESVIKRVADKKKGIEFVKELQQIVGNEINNYYVPIEYAAYSVRSLADVWSSNGATYFEKTILLNKLINHVGFESKLIFSIPEKTFDPEIGNLKDFGKVFIYAKVEDQDLVLSYYPTQKNTLAYDIINDKIIDVKGEEVLLPEYVKETKNRISASGNIDIKENGDYEGRLSIIVTGAQFPYFDCLMDQKNVKKVAESIIPSASIGNVEIVTIDRSGCEIKVDVKGKEIWKNQGDYYYSMVFSSSLGIDAAHLYGITEVRETPVSIGYPVHENYEITYSLPDGFEFVGDGMANDITNSVGELKVAISSSENKVQVNCVIKIDKSEIIPADYSGFKALIDGWNKEKSKTFIIKKVLSVE